MTDTIVFECGTLIDGIADEPVSDALVVVEDGRIEEAGPREAVSAPKDAERVDHSTQTVTPGFVDAHLHLDGIRDFSPMESLSSTTALKTARAAADLPRLLDAGFTTVRDLGSTAAIGLRDAIEEGELVGPRIYTSDRAFSMTAGHADTHSLPYDWVTNNPDGIGIVADGVAECRREARKAIRKGVDCVKIMTSGGMASRRDDPTDAHYTPAEIQAFTEEAHRVGIPVASHANGDAGVSIALENGVDTIEHAIGIGEDTVELAVETDATVVPTLSAIYRLANEGEEYGLPEYQIRKARDHVDRHADSVRRAHKGGVPVALGTDCSPHLHPHGDNAVEFELLVQQAGLDEMDALKAGTSTGARTIPDDDVGAIAEGYHADLVALDEDPLSDISATRSAVTAVYKGGRRVDSAGCHGTAPAASGA